MEYGRGHSKTNSYSSDPYLPSSPLQQGAGSYPRPNHPSSSHQPYPPHDMNSMASNSFQPSHGSMPAPHSPYSMNPPSSRPSTNVGGNGFSLNFYGSSPPSRSSNTSTNNGLLFSQSNSGLGAASNPGSWVRSQAPSGAPNDFSDRAPSGFQSNSTVTVTSSSSDASSEIASTHSSLAAIPTYSFQPQNQGNQFDPFNPFPDPSRRM
jgi:hypothetical protein